jgi:hypothetical protein
MNNDSHVVINKSFTAYVGEDAVNLFRAIALKASLKMYADCGMLPNRNITPTMLLKMATGYTGHTYKGANKYLEAAEGVRIWIETMKAAMPVEES